MSITMCPNCRVANPEDQARCNCCGYQIRRTPTADPINSGPNVVHEHYFHVQQIREAKIAARSLLGAAIILLIRGTVYPLLLTQVPTAMLQGLDPDTLRVLSYSGAAAMFALFMLARTNPLPAALMAIAVYGAICVPDLVNGQGWLGKGIISKAIMAGPLLRALIAGIMYNLNQPTLPVPGAAG